MEAGKMTRSDDLTFYSLLGVLQSGMWLLSDIEKYLLTWGLSHGRFSILLSIMESPDDSLIGNEISARLGVAKATVTKMVEKLASEGYVRCAADPGDMRKKRFSLTRKAENLLREIIPGYRTRLGEISARLTDHDKELLMGILSKINFLDPNKALLKKREKTISEKSTEIEALCGRGRPQDIDRGDGVPG
jgi:DNA-binding MarR family transcriptional regulator